VTGVWTRHLSHVASDIHRSVRSVLIEPECAIGVSCRVYWVVLHAAVRHPVPRSRPRPGSKAILAGSSDTRAGRDALKLAIEIKVITHSEFVREIPFAVLSLCRAKPVIGKLPSIGQLFTLELLLSLSYGKEYSSGVSNLV